MRVIVQQRQVAQGLCISVQAEGGVYNFGQGTVPSAALGGGGVGSNNGSGGAAVLNTGSGGGGAQNTTGGAGAAGICIIRYRID